MAIGRRTLSILSGSVMSLACIVFIVGNVLPSWGIGNNVIVEGTIGLWQACQTMWNEWTCGDLVCLSSSNPIYFNCSNMMVARTFITITCILSAISALSLFACALDIKYSNTILIMISKAVTLFSLLMGIIGLSMGILFVTKGNAYSISVATSITMIALIINLIGVVLVLMIQ